MQLWSKQYKHGVSAERPKLIRPKCIMSLRSTLFLHLLLFNNSLGSPSYSGTMFTIEIITEPSNAARLFFPVYLHHIPCAHIYVYAYRSLILFVSVFVLIFFSATSLLLCAFSLSVCVRVCVRVWVSEMEST